MFGCKKSYRWLGRIVCLESDELSVDKMSAVGWSIVVTDKMSHPGMSAARLVCRAADKVSYPGMSAARLVCRAADKVSYPGMSAARLVCTDNSSGFFLADNLSPTPLCMCVSV